MIQPSSAPDDTRSYDELVGHIESLIVEAIHHIRTNPVRLQEIATEIGDLSEVVNYMRGRGYAEFFRGCVLHLQSKFEEALPYYTVALDIFTSIQDMEGVRYAFRYLGLAHHLLCRYEWALNYYRQELGIRERFFEIDVAGMAGTLTNIATIYLLIGQYDTSMQHYLHALRLMEQEQDHRIYPSIMSNIANLHMALGEYDQALEYQYHILGIYQNSGDEIGEANTLLNMAWNNNRRGAYDEAFLCSNRALELFEAQANTKKMAIAQLYTGQIYMSTHQYKEALVFFEQSYNIAYEIGDRKNCMDTLRAIGDMRTAQGEISSAVEYYRQALAIAQEIGISQAEYELCELLAKAEARAGNAEAALLHYQEYVRIKESVINERRLQAISEMQVRFNAEQAEKEKEIYRLKNVELAEALQKVELLNQDLTEANNEKNELMGIVAHDLKNPITGLSMALSLVENHWSRMTAQDVLYQIGRMKQTVLRMGQIVAKLLDINMIESGKMVLDPVAFNLNEAIRSVVDDYEIRLREKEIHIHCKSVPDVVLVYADWEYTLEVLDNLVSNAIKYSPYRTDVFIRVLVDAAVARVEVQDSGPGIAAADYEKLFKKFARLDARPTGGESSTGLGLSIVKKLVESMNGNVRYDSRPGVGATFIIELPLA